MSLDLRNFVNIQINYHSTVISSAIRGVATFITSNSVYEDDPYRTAGINKDGIFYSYSEYEAAKQATGEPTIMNDTSLDKWVSSFFANKGKALQIIGGFNGSETSSNKVTKILNILKELDYRFVIIVSDVEEWILRKVANTIITTNIIENPLLPEETTVSTFSGLNEKFFISSTTDKSDKIYDPVVTDSAPTWATKTYYAFNNTTGQYSLTQTQPDDWATNWTNYFTVAIVDIQNYVVKVGEKGIEMLAAAYLSKVRINDASSIQDYAFTVEDLEEFPNSLVEDNNEGVQLVKGHKNFDTKLVNAIRNYPGDTLHGEDMMNYYMKILVTQDLSEAVMNLLASKIRFNQTGINRLNNAISQAMNVYIANGYLNGEYIWTGDDLYYSFNGVEYLICSRNTPLVKGYKCVILPLTSLTNEQKEAHVLPPVYLLLADQTGIRAVVINGDVY